VLSLSGIKVVLMFGSGYLGVGDLGDDDRSLGVFHQMNKLLVGKIQSIYKAKSAIIDRHIHLISKAIYGW
jgi:hypothetical protein